MGYCGFDVGTNRKGKQKLNFSEETSGSTNNDEFSIMRLDKIKKSMHVSCWIYAELAVAVNKIKYLSLLVIFLENY